MRFKVQVSDQVYSSVALRDSDFKSGMKQLTNQAVAAEKFDDLRIHVAAPKSRQIELPRLVRCLLHSWGIEDFLPASRCNSLEKHAVQPFESRNGIQLCSHGL